MHTFHVSGKHFLMSLIGIIALLGIWTKPFVHCWRWVLASWSDLLLQLRNSSVCLCNKVSFTWEYFNLNLYCLLTLASINIPLLPENSNFALHSPLKTLASEKPLPLGISNDFLWRMCRYFLEPHTPRIPRFLVSLPCTCAIWVFQFKCSSKFTQI